MSSRTLLTICIGVLGCLAVLQAQVEEDPVYVGGRVCATCHDGPGMGHQYSKWLLLKHARAYAVLAKPEARKIAELSGIPQEPQESTMCLGCHATGAEVEDWERDETFFIEDGVQCEKCHGPGSEYIGVETMRDPEAAMRAGLKMPTEQTCLVCHHEKGSHVAIHQSPKLDIQKALKEIAHPTPDPREYDEVVLNPGSSAGDQGGPEYIGVQACAECHKGPMMGYQFSNWRQSAHAKAYARLATPEAYEMARSKGIAGHPQQSPDCLRCHTTSGGTGAQARESYFLDEGVGCEACHGPGSEYQFEAVMIDHQAALAAGLKEASLDTCLKCHAEAHGKPFEYAKAWNDITHPNVRIEVAEGVRYKTPINVAISPDSKELYVACEASDSVIILDAQTRRKVDEIIVGGQPHDVAFSPDGSKAYVTNRQDDTLSEIDTARREVLRTAPVGDEPHAVITDLSGETLFVLNTSEDSVSVLDARSLDEIKRLSASRNPWSLSLSPDGTQLLVTNTLSRLVEFRTPSNSEITVIDLQSSVVENRLQVPGANLLQGIDWHPSGEFALFTLNRSKNLVPMTRLLQGWTITNGLGIAWKDGRIDQVLLDEPDMCFPDPADVAFTPDGRLAFVTSSGSNRVAVVDVSKLTSMLLAATESDRVNIFPNHLGKPTEFVLKHIETEKSPRGLLVSPDGNSVFVTNALDDSLTVIDVASLEAVEAIDLGGPKEITKVRFGEQVFHSANVTFHRQFSCHTCHPDGHVDGITYDIEPDGVGVSPVDNRTLRGILDTAPFKWEGTNPNLQRQCGPRLAVFFTRIQPFNPTQLSAIENYIATIPRPPNRYRPLGAPLTDAQRRGKRMFERTMANDGSVLPPEGRCVTCHPTPLYTNHTVVDVGTKMKYDREVKFDVPHLNNIYDSAPYLHNGIAHTLEEIWTRYNPEDKHGVTNDMTKDQLNDLIEYIKTF